MTSGFCFVLISTVNSEPFQSYYSFTQKPLKCDNFNVNALEYQINVPRLLIFEFFPHPNPQCLFGTRVYL